MIYTPSETPEAATGYKFVVCEDRTHHTFSSPQKVCVDAYKDGSSVVIVSANGKDVVIELSDATELEKQRHALIEHLAAVQHSNVELIVEVDTLKARVERDELLQKGGGKPCALTNESRQLPTESESGASDAAQSSNPTDAATIAQLQTELAALSDAKQKLWVRLNAAEHAKLALDKMIGELMAERDGLKQRAAFIEDGLPQSIDLEDHYVWAVSELTRRRAYTKPEIARVIGELRAQVEQFRKDGERLRVALCQQHRWHLDQTERTPVFFGDDIGQINADEYQDSELYQATEAALKECLSQGEEQG